MTGKEEYQAEELRPGWTYLNGQIKLSELIEAIAATDDAWDAYNRHVELMIVNGKTGDEGEVIKMAALLRAAQEAEAEQQRLYALWNQKMKEAQDEKHD